MNKILKNFLIIFICTLVSFLSLNDETASLNIKGNFSSNRIIEKQNDINKVINKRNSDIQDGGE